MTRPKAKEFLYRLPFGDLKDVILQTVLSLYPLLMTTWGGDPMGGDHTIEISTTGIRTLGKYRA